MPINFKYETFLRLYRREEGAFAMLPFITRAVAAYSLKLADDDGRIPLGGRDPAAAIAILGRASSGDRRVLRRVIPELIDEGYLYLSDDHLVIKNFRLAQGKPPPAPQVARDASRARVEHEPSTSRTRTVHESDVNRARDIAKSAEFKGHDFCFIPSFLPSFLPSLSSRRGTGSRSREPGWCVRARCC